MGKDEESLVIRVSRVRLDLNLILFKQVPVFTILKASLHEYAIQIGGEVLPTDDLPNEVHLRFKISLRAQLASQLLHLINLLLLHVFQSLLLSFSHGVFLGRTPVVVVVGLWCSIAIIQLTESVLLYLVLVILTHVVVVVEHFYCFYFLPNILHP